MYSNGVFSASEAGALFTWRKRFKRYATGSARRQRQVRGQAGRTGSNLYPRISPDGKIVAFSLIDPNTGKADIWTQDVSSGNRTRITRDPRAERRSHLVSQQLRYFLPIKSRENKPTIFMMPSNGMGVEQKVWEPVHGGWPDDVTPDSKTLVVDERSEMAELELPYVPLEQHAQTTPLFETPGANVFNARLSADGHWIAYESDESGKREVYVSAFPKPAGRLQVSSAGGRRPALAWRWQRTLLRGCGNPACGSRIENEQRLSGSTSPSTLVPVPATH